MKRFITSDWHLGESRFKLFQRNFYNQKAMIDHFVEKHNEIVGSDDLVYVVGDVIDDRHPRYLKSINKFHGRKILIRGNHDRRFSDADFQPYFEQIVAEGDGLEIEVGGLKFWATHYPTCGRLDMFNLVGHVHSAWKVQLNMLNVGVDVNHYAPFDLDVDVPFMYNTLSKCDDDIWAAYDNINQKHKGSRGASGRCFP